MTTTQQRSFFLTQAALLALTLCLGGCSFAPKIGLGAPEGPLKEHTVSGEGKARIAVIDIAGVIELAPRSSGLIGQSDGMLSRLESELTKAAKDKRIAAVIIRVDSPGGGLTASDMIFERIARFRRETGIPVIAQLMQVAASGGYYIALAADSIIAHPTTLTGSIGVIMPGLNFGGLLERLGITDQTIKAGAVKDIGSPTRPMTSEERALLEALLAAGRDTFIERIAASRKIDRAEVDRLADGRIFGAAEAQRLRLIDRIGYHADAVAMALSAAKLTATEARVVIYRRSGEPSENVHSTITSARSSVAGTAAIAAPWAELAAIDELAAIGVSLAIPLKDQPTTAAPRP